MAQKGFGRFFKRKDGKYFVYLPKNLVEDTGFPFPLKSSTRVKVYFIAKDKKIVMEGC